MGESTMMRSYIVLSICLLHQCVQGAALFRRDVPFGNPFGPPFGAELPELPPCPMFECPFQPCADSEEMYIPFHLFPNGYCCPTCPSCKPIGTDTDDQDCAASLSSDDQVTPVPSDDDEENVTVGEGSQSHPKKGTNFETTNMISSLPTPTPTRTESVETAAMNRLKSIGQTIASILGWNGGKQTVVLEGRTVPAEGVGPKMNDLGNPSAGNGESETTTVSSGSEARKLSAGGGGGAQNDEGGEEGGEYTTEGLPDALTRDIIIECPKPPGCPNCSGWDQTPTWIKIEGTDCPGCPICNS